MKIEDTRDKLLKNLKIDEKDAERRSGYVDGVLDMYNEVKKEVMHELHRYLMCETTTT